MKTSALTFMLAVWPLLCLAQPSATPPSKPAAEAEPKTTGDATQQQLFGKDGKDWSKYLVDPSPGSISAFGLLGIPGESVATVENVRDVVVAVKGLGSNASGIGFSVTPARTSFLAMDLQSYAANNFDRLLGATTLGYAQGPTSIANRDYQRRAFSVETNYFFRREHDPLIAVWDKFKAGACDVLPTDAPTADLSKTEPRVEEEARRPGEASKAEVEAAKAKAEKCRTDALAALPWNRSQISASFVTGVIRPEDASTSQQSLGRSLAMGIVYGFDQSGYLKEKAAAYLTLRRTINEPVLDTLATPSVEHKSSSLAVLRVAAGSKTFRGLAEVSNAKATGITPTQRAYKQAAGFDYRMNEGLWLNFRIGKQRKFDGSGDETTSLFSVSYSPSALLK